MQTRTLVVWAVAFALVGPSWAADDSPATAAEKEKAANEVASLAAKPWALDGSVPEIPAFTVLGLTSKSIPHANTSEDLVTAALTGFDQSGHLQAGQAIEFLPWMLWRGKDITLGQYRKSYATRILSTARFSIATAKGLSESDKAVRSGFGLYVTLFGEDDLDLGTNLGRGLDKEYLRAASAGDKARTDFLKGKGVDAEHEPRRPEDEAIRTAADAASTAAFNGIWAKAVEDARGKQWNRTRWLLGLGLAGTSEDGALHKMTYDSLGVWSSLVLGLGPDAQAQLYGQWRDRQHVSTGADNNTFYRQNSIEAGGEIRLGNKTHGYHGEAVYHKVMPTGAPKDDYWRLGFGFDIPLPKAKQWLNVSWEHDIGRNGSNDQALTASFNWSLGNDESSASATKERPAAPTSNGTTTQAVAAPTPPQERTAAPPVQQPASKLVGKVNGKVTGKLTGTLIGKLNGKLQGSVEGKLDGKFEGQIEGTIRGTMEGTMEGSMEGTIEGTIEGATAVASPPK